MPTPRRPPANTFYSLCGLGSLTLNPKPAQPQVATNFANAPQATGKEFLQGFFFAGRSQEPEGGGEGGAAAKSGDTGGGDQEVANVLKSRGLEHTEARSRDAPLRPPPSRPKGVLRKVSRYPIFLIIIIYLF